MAPNVYYSPIYFFRGSEMHTQAISDHTVTEIDYLPVLKMYIVSVHGWKKFYVDKIFNEFVLVKYKAIFP